MKTNCKKILGLAVCALTLGALTGCIGYVDGPGPATVYVQPPDDYIYYPGYQVYYSSNRRQYMYQEGHSWVTRSSPPHVSSTVLLSSPSVRLDFHDSPVNHHAAIAKQYPKQWAPAGAKHGNPEEQRNGNKEGH